MIFENNYNFAVERAINFKQISDCLYDTIFNLKPCSNSVILHFREIKAKLVNQ